MPKLSFPLRYLVLASIFAFVANFSACEKKAAQKETQEETQQEKQKQPETKLTLSSELEARMKAVPAIEEAISKIPNLPVCAKFNTYWPTHPSSWCQQETLQGITGPIEAIKSLGLPTYECKSQYSHATFSYSYENEKSFSAKYHYDRSPGNTDQGALELSPTAVTLSSSNSCFPIFKCGGNTPKYANSIKDSWKSQISFTANDSWKVIKTCITEVTYSSSDENPSPTPTTSTSTIVIVHQNGETKIESSETK